jgi:hypothetical protein
LIAHFRPTPFTIRPALSSVPDPQRTFLKIRSPEANHQW